MSKSLSVTFRLPAELVESFTAAVSDSGSDKTAWLIGAVRHKINQPDSNVDNRMLALVKRLETAAAAQTIRDGFDNGRIIAERLNEAGYQTKVGKAWDKDIYSAWKRQGSNFNAIKIALETL
ncbi:hypothetical protein [Yersinia aleksiciae]|uniref:hypothetical protein n=1 Tax=Yersinia aleksiciae TaxID=263819 RepID=UPI00119EC747|nr:hypothetical protein [Yersinia aleksiciae]